MGYGSACFISCSWTHCHEAEEVRWYDSFSSISAILVKKALFATLLLDALSLILPNYLPIFCDEVPGLRRL